MPGIQTLGIYPKEINKKMWAWIYEQEEII
jgi:hypothetical protein